MTAADTLGRQFGENPNYEQPMEGHIGKYLYHHSPPEVRDQILQQGLKTANPFNPEIHEDKSKAPKGVYLGPYEHTVHSSWDTWAVDTNRISTRPDPDDEDNYWGFHYSRSTIPPNMIHLIHRGNNER